MKKLFCFVTTLCLLLILLPTTVLAENDSTYLDSPLDFEERTVFCGDVYFPVIISGQTVIGPVWLNRDHPLEASEGYYKLDAGLGEILLEVTVQTLSSPELDVRSYTLTIYSAHADAEKDHVCDNCGDTIGTCEDTDLDHYCDYGCGKFYSTHAPASADIHVCAYCGVPTTSSCVDETPKDHKCDVCGETISGHNFVWRDGGGQYWQECDDCHETTEKAAIPSVAINGADTVCLSKDYTFTFPLPDGCTDATAGYSFPLIGDESRVIPTNGVCSYTVGCSGREDITSFGVWARITTADGYPFLVSKQVSIQSQHAGGTATCTQRAKCTTCGDEYGEPDTANHSLEHNKETAATVTETGNTEYWRCKNCGNIFSDKDGTKPITQKDTVTPKLTPEIIDGKGQSLTTGDQKDLRFRSNAAFSEFVGVELDGKALDEKHYTADEGSTIVTLKSAYIATLSAGEHTLSILSESGTASTTFTIRAKDAEVTLPTTGDGSNDVEVTPPATGDGSNMVLWIVLLAAATAGVTSLGVYGKKHHTSGM